MKFKFHGKEYYIDKQLAHLTNNIQTADEVVIKVLRGFL